jgi:hypothetical protein
MLLPLRSPPAPTAAWLALSLLLASACAGRRPADDLPGPPAGSVPVQISILDKGGDALAGEVDLFGAADRDRCVIDGKGCTLQLPPGDYALVFRRAPRKGRGEAEVQKAAGCLRARVTVLAGRAIVCKRRAAYNCSDSASETLDCGPAKAAAAPAGT